MAAVSSVINSSFLRGHENRLLPLPLAPPPPPPSFQFHPNLNFPSLRIRCSSSSSPFNDNTHISLNKTHSPHPTNPLACRFHASRFGGQESSKSYVETYAIGRHIRMSANKARRVAEQIRGRPYDETLMILELMPYRACEPILKIVFSAGANASNNLGLSKGSLIISNAVVDEGKTMKRMRAGARGRAHPIKKRTCHIKISVKGLPSESAVEAKPA